ncbi:hypothetical protein S969_000034 [Salmonella enterica subsp. salamae serovar 6,7:z:1,5]|nr:hypothetical protein [Salmonella enterica subsp. salamae serovar 6,7:z:1,5]EHA0428165.1 hypothetical protein [Salmonella enterica subsp. enterica serovar Muenchen]
MSKPKIKNTVRISFTVIDEHGEEALNRDYFVPFERIKQASFPVLPEVANTEAQKFHEAAVMMDCFGK